MEPRAEDLAVIAEFRSARIAAVEKASRGHVDQVLRQPTSAEAAVYVVKLLDVVPGVGKVAGRRLLSSIGLSPFDRVGDLTAKQIETILQVCRVRS